MPSSVLDGRFDPHGPPVVTVMDASGVAALGRLALHTGDHRQLRQTSDIAKAMLNESTPGVRRKAAWLLSLQATADGDPRQAHQWLCAMGEPERTDVLSRLWLDMADEPQMVRMAIEVGDRELGESAAAHARRRAELSPGVPSLHAIAAHATGLLDGDIDKLSEVATLFDRSPLALARAAAWEDLGLAATATRDGRAGDRRSNPGAGPVCASRCDPRCSETPKPPPRARDSTPGGGRREASHRTGGDDEVRARGRSTRIGWPHQPRGRRPALCIAAHGEHTPSAGIRKARDQLAG